MNKYLFILRKKPLIVIVILFVISYLLFISLRNLYGQKENSLLLQPAVQPQSENIASHPLMIEQMRQKDYPGSEIVIEQELAPGINYHQYIVSYKSADFKIFALMTIPLGDKPEGGWPAIVFNHGYILPEEYSTTQRYVTYVDGFAQNGYIVFKPDYRGHGDSEGKPEGAYYSPAYTEDVLNAVASLKKHPDVNPQKIGMWGHSMGGHITLRSMVISKDIKAGVIWAGVVASYEDMLNRWRRSTPWQPSMRENAARRPTRQELIEKFGTPQSNPQFWQSISPIYFVPDISSPVQLHHGLADESVPYEFSQSLENALRKSGKEVEYFSYEGGDHNLSGSAFNLAMQRSVEFFDRYLK